RGHAAEDQRSIVDHVAIGQGTAATRRSDLQRAALFDRRSAGVSVDADQGQSAAAGLYQATVARDLAAEEDVVGAVKNKRTVVDHVTRQIAPAAAVADPQRAAVLDHGAATIVVVDSGQGQDAAAGLHQTSV